MKNYIPFPQANDLLKVIEIRKILPIHRSKIKVAIKEYFQFSSRQSDYYYLAGLWLGLYHEDADKVVVSLLDDRDVYAHINNEFLCNEVFSNAFKNRRLSRKQQMDLVVRDLVLNSNMNTLVTSTHYRRASTVLKWIDQLNVMNDDK